MTGEEPALSEKISQQLNIMRILFSMQEGDVFFCILFLFSNNFVSFMCLRVMSPCDRKFNIMDNCFVFIRN